MRSNLFDFHTLLEESKHSFNVICLIQTWLNHHEFKTNSNYHSPNYEGIHYGRKTNKSRDGVLIYIRNDFCVFGGDREILATELLRNNMKNVIVSCCYKPPNGNWKNHCDHVKKVLTNATMEYKLYFFTGDFNLSCLEFHQNSEIRQFFNNLFEKGAICLISRPTRVTTSTVILIDNIFTNCIFDTFLKKGIIKTFVSDHFAIFTRIKLSTEETKNPKNKH